MTSDTTAPTVRALTLEAGRLRASEAELLDMLRECLPFIADGDLESVWIESGPRIHRSALADAAAALVAKHGGF